MIEKLKDNSLKKQIANEDEIVFRKTKLSQKNYNFIVHTAE